MHDSTCTTGRREGHTNLVGLTGTERAVARAAERIRATCPGFLPWHTRASLLQARLTAALPHRRMYWTLSSDEAGELNAYANNDAPADRVATVCEWARHLGVAVQQTTARDEAFVVVSAHATREGVRVVVSALLYRAEGEPVPAMVARARSLIDAAGGAR
ncbi:hypothetical protein BJF83_17500 [Nocardiopsis sp. CNR-923]|uniref:hypothetical protein n=1 Tax=Nocardiopsis sp. CNR-923 TaxID=1904965 RepID=UPI0009632F97|nr:hypothetical protein [Nocardiopsis sp. CNR-923]OLT27779.1 hypothetical protein BJF83_17500 [Nocardiopsis sp. CNR-923]